MSTKQFSNYESLITFTRASKGHALRPVSYGDDLFDSDTSNWSRGVFSVDGTLIYSTNQLTQTLGAGDTSGARWVLPITCVVGEVLRITVDSVAIGNGATSGGIGITANSNGSGYSDDVSIPAGGTEVRVPATATTMYLTITTSGSSGATTTVTNVTVKKAIFDQPDGTLTLFEHPDNVPRVEWDADGNRLGLLVEESRTNLLPYSEDFSTDWNNTNSDIDVNPYGGSAPDGQASGFEISEPSTTTTHALRDTHSFTSGLSYTFSVFAKKSTSDWCQLLFGAGAFSSMHQNFNLATGQKGGGSGFNSSEIQDYGNGWYRISITATATVTASTDIFIVLTDNADSARLPSYLGDGTSGIYIWGAQLEAGSFPTSYIKNEGTSSGVTRSADVAKIEVDQFGYNQSEGTVVVEAKTFSNAEANHGDFALTDSGTSPDLSSGSRTGSSVAGSYSTWYKTAGTTQANLVRTSAVEDNVFYKAGFCYKANDFAQSVDGGSILSDSSGTVPSRNSVVLIGDNYYGKLNGHIKSIKYYPRRLSDAQLVELTS